jgi:hypothetical protein
MSSTAEAEAEIGPVFLNTNEATFIAHHYQKWDILSHLHHYKQADNTTQHNTTQHNTTQHNTTQHQHQHQHQQQHKHKHQHQHQHQHQQQQATTTAHNNTKMNTGNGYAFLLGQR